MEGRVRHLQQRSAANDASDIGIAMTSNDEECFHGSGAHSERTIVGLAAFGMRLQLW
jgi:hypothetical protein